MNILIIGDQRRADELRSKLAADAHIHHASSFIGDDLRQYEVIFDLNFDDDNSSLSYLLSLENIPVFVCAVKKQLAGVHHSVNHEIKVSLIGMNALPTFINRPKMEISLFDKANENIIIKVSEKLGWQYEIVEDRVGMVSPRILFMIINEACYTLQEGTADVRNIDMAMKLGTNYPFGPFEWCDRIGVKDVYETLDALYNDTHDERYKICSLLKTKYLKRETFYP